MNLTERYSRKLAARTSYSLQNLDGILVQIEVTNACNHKCIFCPNKHHTRSVEMIDFQLAKEIIVECANFLGKNKKICFHMNGEPLLYQRLTELIFLSKKYGYDYVFLTTNGSLATPTLLTSLLEAGLDSIKFSINAGTKETYKFIHGADDFDKVIEALEFCSNYKQTHKNKKIQVFVSCVGIKNNRDELLLLKNRVSSLCDEVVFYYPCSYAGQQFVDDLWCDLSNMDLNVFDIQHSIPCPVLWNSINITSGGYLALCCSEADSRLIVEDVKKVGVWEAWTGGKMMEVRKKHLERDINDIPCSSCVLGTPYNKMKINQNLFGLALAQQRKGDPLKC